MLKKSVVYGALLATVCITPSLAHSFYKTGFLAGAQVGASFGNGKFNSTLNANPANPINVFPANGTGRKTSALFGVLGGYRSVFNQDMTLGLLVEANFFSTNDVTKLLSHAGITFNNRIKKNYSIIPTIALGKIFNGRWHASLGLGLAFTRFKQQVDTVNVNPALTANASQNKVGFVPSIGVEYASTPNVSLFGNLSYEIYGSTRKTFTNSAFIANNTSYTTSVKPRYVSVKIGAVYKF